MKYFFNPKLLATICALFFINFGYAQNAIKGAQIDHTFGIYSKAWGEADPAARAALLQQVWAEDGQYKDPGVAVKGVDALSQHIGEFLQQFPNAKITTTSSVGCYGSAFRADWLMDFRDGKTPALEGFDYGELDGDGRIAKITGFFGPLLKTEIVQNEAIVTKYLEALFTKFDYAALDQVLSPKVVYRQAAGLPYGGTFVGLPEMVKMFKKSTECSRMVVLGGWKLSTDPQTKKVIASFTVRSTALKSGKTLDMEIEESYDLRDGKIVGITPFYYDTKTLDEFVSEEAVTKVTP